MGLSERKEQSNQTVVDSYIDTCEPVSSADIQANHLPSLSTATIRNELASLEEMGLPRSAAHVGGKSAYGGQLTGYTSKNSCRREDNVHAT